MPTSERASWIGYVCNGARDTLPPGTLTGLAINSRNDTTVVGAVIGNLHLTMGVGLSIIKSSTIPKNSLVVASELKSPHFAVDLHGDLDGAGFYGNLLAGDTAGTNRRGFNINPDSTAFTGLYIEHNIFRDFDLIPIAFWAPAPIVLSDIIIRNNDYKNCPATHVETTNVTFDNTCYIEGLASLPSVAATAAITLPILYEFINITGIATITSITATSADVGREVTLLINSTAALTDGGNLKLNGSFGGSPDDTITLKCDGTNWYEVARSIN